MSENNEKVENAKTESPDKVSMKSIYGPLALFVLGTVLLMGFAAQKEEQNKIPKEITYYSNCEVTAKSAVMAAGVVWDTLKTSCGYFPDPLIIELEKGKVYDLEVSKSPFGSSIIKVTLSSDKEDTNERH